MKISVRMNQATIAELDRLVEERTFKSRSHAVAIAVREKWARLAKTRLWQECAKLDPREEQAFAEFGIESDQRLGPRY